MASLRRSLSATASGANALDSRAIKATQSIVEHARVGPGLDSPSSFASLRAQTTDASAVASGAHTTQTHHAICQVAASAPPLAGVASGTAPATPWQLDGCGGDDEDNAVDAVHSLMRRWSSEPRMQHKLHQRPADVVTPVKPLPAMPAAATPPPAGSNMARPQQSAGGPGPQPSGRAPAYYAHLQPPHQYGHVPPYAADVPAAGVSPVRRVRPVLGSWQEEMIRG
eukprot:XP_001690475.1 predicted protein [Chlamydomonas reinhardtii]